MAPESGTSPIPADVKVRLKATYDTIAETYNKWTEQHTELRMQYLDQLLAALPATSTTLTAVELGCGAGVPVTQRLLKDNRFAHITANDLSSSQITIGKTRLGDSSARLTWVEGDMTALSFPPASVDAVLGFYSLIHLPREEQVVMLGKITAWLKPGGYLLANFSKENEESVVNETWLSKENGWTFWSGYGVDKTLEKVRESGLEIVVGDVGKGDGVDSGFLWLLARK